MKIRELEVKYGRVIGEMDDQPIKDDRLAAEFFRGWLGDCTEERFVAILLDARNRVIGAVEVSRGTLTASLVHPREVFKAAVMRNAGHIILAHNHPSGEVEPSREDHEVTARLAEAGKILGISVLDSIVVTDHAHYSFKAQGVV